MRRRIAGGWLEWVCTLPAPADAGRRCSAFAVDIRLRGLPRRAKVPVVRRATPAAPPFGDSH